MIKTSHSRFKHDVVETYSDGDKIFVEGENDKNLYIIQEGEVRILKKIGDQDVELVVFRRGEFFGDIGLLQNVPRYASAFAKGDTSLLILRPAGFLLKIRRDPTFAFELMQQLSHRVMVSNDRLIELATKMKLSKAEIQEILIKLDGRS